MNSSFEPPDAKKRRLMEDDIINEEDLSSNDEFMFPDDILDEIEEMEIEQVENNPNNNQDIETQSCSSGLSDQIENNEITSELMSLVEKYTMLKNEIDFVEAAHKQFQKLLKLEEALKADSEEIVINIQIKDGYLRISAKFKEPQDLGELCVIVNYKNKHKNFIVNSLTKIETSHEPSILLDLPLTGFIKIKSIYLGTKYYGRIVPPQWATNEYVKNKALTLQEEEERKLESFGSLKFIQEINDSFSSSEDECENFVFIEKDHESNVDEESFNVLFQENEISLKSFFGDYSEDDQYEPACEATQEIFQIFSYKLKVY